MAVYTQVIDMLSAGLIGADKGLLPADLEPRVEALLPMVENLAARKNTGQLPMLALAERTDDLPLIINTADAIRRAFKTLVVLGTGGSVLGGRALVALKENALGNINGPTQVKFIDNVDPDTMDSLTNALDPQTTAFLVISKSGSTVETLTQLLSLLDWARAKLGPQKTAGHFFMITMPGDNPLRRIGQAEGMMIFDHDPNLGGRFSVFSNVGLLPAAVAGLDIAALRAGAKVVVEASLDKQNYVSAAPVVGAAVHAALMEDKGCHVSVMMAYVDKLADFGLWWRQIWAESLGKNGFGSTPVRAQGTLDQHSQLQLYLAGPKDKFISVVLCEQAGKGLALSSDDPELDYLKDKRIGDVLEAEQRATIETLVRNKLPVRVFHLPLLDEARLGGLMMHCMLETLFTAALLGVNAYDQPAVEEGKVLARDYLKQGKEASA